LLHFLKKDHGGAPNARNSVPSRKFKVGKTN